MAKATLTRFQPLIASMAMVSLTSSSSLNCWRVSSNSVSETLVDANSGFQPLTKDKAVAQACGKSVPTHV